ncbi:MAG: hypothetical protein JJE19_00320 [Methanosarcinales archaeon]|nr:hypothetical protein [Methanosarcinales archaeon]
MTFTAKTEKIKSALTSKGFVKEERSKHTFYILVVDGKKTPIHTKLSRGSKEYSKKLLSFMREQLGFEKMRELKDFIECPMSKEEYVRILEERGRI